MLTGQGSLLDKVAVHSSQWACKLHGALDQVASLVLAQAQMRQVPAWFCSSKGAQATLLKAESFSAAQQAVICWAARGLALAQRDAAKHTILSLRVPQAGCSLGCTRTLLTCGTGARSGPWRLQALHHQLLKLGC